MDMRFEDEFLFLERLLILKDLTIGAFACTKLLNFSKISLIDSSPSFFDSSPRRQIVIPHGNVLQDEISPKNI